MRAILYNDQKQFCDDWEENCAQKFSNMSFREYEAAWMKNRIIKTLEVNGYSLEDINKMDEDTMYGKYLEIKKKQNEVY